MEALAESEARFRAMADSAPALMWVTKLDGRREFVNAAYTEFLGMTFDAAVDFDWRDRIHPEDLPRILVEQRQSEARRGSFTLEARYLRADGQWRWLKSRSQARFAPDGTFLGFIGIAFDDTDAKRAESDLQHINELLQERIAAALAERDTAQAALAQAQKLEAIGRLTGGVAHDFNNLLTVIIGALDILQNNPPDDARRARLINAAVTAARRGERLNQQLLAFSRRQPLRPEVANLDAVLAEAEPLLRRAVGDQAQVRFDLGSDGALARLDVAQFESAVMNLLVNARDAMPGGGMARVTSERVTLAAPRGEAAAGEYVAVCVLDEGEGMAPEVAAQAFEPFFTTKAVGKGAGLGLSQVYGFVRQSGGAAEIDTAPGAGTTVRLLLPRIEAEAPIQAEPEAVGPTEARRVEVLLVEDDEEVGELVTAMLGELGHTVRRAADADEALAALAGPGGGVGLVMTDVVMPGLRNGLDLAAEIERSRPGLPIILISGFIGEALGDAEAAPWPLLKKPFPLADLNRAIAAATAVRAPAVGK
jgi:PAS domain S-box-containing protein